MAVLSYSTYDLVNVIKDLAASDPFVSLREPQTESQGLEWVADPQAESLTDHLLMQVRLSNWTSKNKAAVKQLIYNLAADGYLRTGTSELLDQTGLSFVELRHAKESLQSLDPCGIGTQDLNECLLIQARQITNFDQVALRILIDQQLELLADPASWSQLNYSRQELTAALASIQTLNPLPASEYVAADSTQYLVPDLIYKVVDQRITVESFQQQIPELIFDEASYTKLKAQTDQQQYFSTQRERYLELKNAINQRHQTMMRLGKYVGHYQHDFLLSLKKEELKPLGLKEVAQALDLAPSTISRAIKDKYIQCQNKIFSLKILFPRQVTDNISQTKIEHELLTLIQTENPARPLTDQQIVALLADQGIHLSRRVIAKYRAKLRIPNSYARKK
ncbi:RNA polymerase factor sigma-54 [Lactobacillus sp. ESL0684]|uniref:RNA polymerase factor sigma-54 n=1 Tax=Lactobacillus sp. ESL0684 TaxID=2983213 RepID=UPI0023F789F6|nr:RNA polymerase factor sigma-54 [Lactobacillus sp. ESL0684]WEV43395.1 RNA polymerase factor sigma-54 [Lactobacillus sp. ESL0684]